MKLYMHPISTSSRPVRLLIAENNLDVEEQVVDLMTGEHTQDPYAAINPNKLVPTLEDGDFRLTESSAILKYLADKFELRSYPKDLQKRARVNERMDWFNTQFSREFSYGLIYPQLFPHHKRPSDAVQAATLAWGKERAAAWLKVLDKDIIGPNQQYLCGNEITIADYFGACLITLGKLTRCDFSAYPNVSRWLANMEQLDTWDSVNEALDGFAAQLKDQPFVAIGD
ncbi:MAG: glutathione S-transferase family protein [Gammaproteobacteria bacterium]|nr:glutathione S-transferase family protein [Gammaproteobacteria bacterium]